MANANTGEANRPQTESTSNSNAVISPILGGNHFTLFGMSLTQTHSIKLDRDNYLLWKNMILPIIRGHNLEGYLLGTKVCPSEFIPSYWGIRD